MRAAIISKRGTRATENKLANPPHGERSDFRKITITKSSTLAIIVQQGRVLDFIDGKNQRLETPKEYVRQEIAKSLIREYLLRS